jgi:TRAP-type C4-dicarboxylate transport system permease small subunit
MLLRAAVSAGLIIKTISQGLNYLGTTVLVAMMLLTVADVSMRYVLSLPILGSTELTEYMIVCVVFLGLAWCAIKERHIKVDLVVSRFSPRLQASVKSITLFLGLGICALTTWRSFLEAIDALNSRRASPLLTVPAYPFYLVFSLGFAILCLVMITQLVENAAKVIKE